MIQTTYISCSSGDLRQWCPDCDTVAVSFLILFLLTPIRWHMDFRCCHFTRIQLAQRFIQSLLCCEPRLGMNITSLWWNVIHTSFMRKKGEEGSLFMLFLLWIETRKAFNTPPNFWIRYHIVWYTLEGFGFLGVDDGQVTTNACRTS